MKTRYAAAALVLVATAALADDFARVISSAPVVEPIPGTSNSRIVRYVVTYEFQGKRYTVNLPSDPGPRIRVQGGANYAPPPAVPVATVPAPAPVFVTPPPVVYAPPVAYGPAYYPAPYPYVGAYNPIVPFGIGVGLGVLAGGWGGYGWRGGYWHGGGWRR